MFWDLYQTRQIGRVGRKANQAGRKADQSLDHSQRMEDKIDALALACQALWELLRDNTDLTGEQLEEKMEEVDLRDGKRDGMLSKVAEACSTCGRKTSRRRPNCLYCGKRVESSELFGKR